MTTKPTIAQVIRDLEAVQAKLEMLGPPSPTIPYWEIGQAVRMLRELEEKS